MHRLSRSISVLKRPMGSNSVVKPAYVRVALILMVMIASLGINLWAIHQQTHLVHETRGREMLDQYANNIYLQLHFYKSVLRGLARQQEIKDLLMLGDYDTAQEWARKQRAHLPL